jgi:Leucine-rich repeat (LRR) protein
MKALERKQYQEIINLILKTDYDLIDEGISLLVKNGNKEFFELILNNCRIKEGILIASVRFTLPSPKQPYIDYALWNVIGYAPDNINVHRSLKKKNIKHVKLSSYESFSYNFHAICKFPKGITKYYNLITLDLSRARVKSIPIEIEKLNKLKTIDLKFNDLKEFPIGICQIETLTSLDLFNNEIEILPDYINKLINLENLCLDDNKINKLPNGIGDLKCLNSLDLNNNDITILPNEIGELTNLEYLGLSYNKISKIPNSINNLKKLNNLELKGNKLKEIPNIKLTSLKIIDLSYNEISILSNTISNMISLECLILTGNRKLSIIENGITSLSNLNRIDLGMTGNLKPKPAALYLSSREMIDVYFKKILLYYKLIKRSKRINLETDENKSKLKKYIDYNNDYSKIPKKIESIINNLSNYLNSKEIDVIDVGINLVSSISNQAVYNYLFGKQILNNGEIKQYYYSNGFYYDRYNYENYIILRLILESNHSISFKRNIKLENIKTLNYNFFKERDHDFIFNLINLQTIKFNLSNNDLNKSFYRLKKLNDIELYAIKNLDEIKFDRFEELESLFIEKSSTSGNLILSNNKSLKKIKLRNIDADTLIISNNDQLEELSIITLNLKNLQITNCNKLRKLHIYNCRIKMGSEISNFPNLIKLFVRDTALMNMMNFVYSCIKLEEIELSQIKGLKLNELIGDLINLKELDLADNGINELPNNIGKLTELKKLKLQNNNLKEIPSSLANCKKLKYVDLSYQTGNTKATCSLNDIPQEIFKNKNLCNLQVSWTSMKLRKYISKLSASDIYVKSRVITNY